MAAAALLSTLVWLAPAAEAQVVPGTGELCKALPLVSGVCQALTNPAGAAKNVAGSVAGAVTGDVFGSIASGISSWAKGLLGDLANYVQKGVARPDFGSKQFAQLYGRMEWVGLVVGFVAFIWALAGSWRRSMLDRLWIVGRAVLAGAFLPQIPRLADLAYSVVGELSGFVSKGFGGDLGSITTSMTSGFAGAATSGGLQFVMGLVGFVGGLLVLLDLVVVTVGAYILVVFMPILAGLAIHDAGVRWLKRAAVLLVVAISALFVVTACGALGAALIAGGTWSQVNTVLAGGVLLILTAYAPWGLARLLGAEIGLHRGHLAEAGAAATGAVATIAKVAA